MPEFDGKGMNWDGEEYTEGGGGAFINKDLFNRFVYTDAVISITAVRTGISNYDPQKPQEQWLIDFIGPDGEEYTKGVSKTNVERNARVERIIATIEATGEPVDSTPFYVGQRIEFGKPKVGATK